MLSAEAIHFTRTGMAILRGIDLDIRPGEIVGLGGASGAGKTTLGLVLAGRLRPSSGHVRLDGADVAQSRPGRPAPVQYAPQTAEIAVDPRWRVGRILANSGMPDHEACDALGVSPAWRDRFPSELSGGELARVSLARVFHPGLRALVCDEVTAQLDALEQAAFLSRLTALARRRGVGIVLISHSAALRARHGDRATMLENGRLVDA